MDLDSMLHAINKCAECAIFSYKDGTWSCKAEMRGLEPGCKVEFHSGYRHKTAGDAVRKVYQQLDALRPMQHANSSTVKSGGQMHLRLS